MACATMAATGSCGSGVCACGSDCNDCGLSECAQPTVWSYQKACPDNPDGTTTVVGPCEFDDDVEDDCDD